MTDHSNASPNLTRPLFPWWFWVVSATITLVWFFGPQIISWHRGSGNALTANEFGDQFGSINTLFSGLAFLGVLAGIFIQGREFRNQLSEMALNAEEMKNQTDIYRSQLREAREHTKLVRQQHNAEKLQLLASELPYFTINIAQHLGDHYTFAITNLGSPVYGMHVFADGIMGDTIFHSVGKERNIVRISSSNVADGNFTWRFRYILISGTEVTEKIPFSTQLTYTDRQKQIAYLKDHHLEREPYEVGSLMESLLG